MNMLSVIRCFIKGQIVYNTVIYTYIDVKKISWSGYYLVIC